MPLFASSSKRFDLKDKRAIVTGGAQGIGLEFCRCLLKAGAKVCVADLDQQAGAKAVDGLRTQFGVEKERYTPFLQESFSLEA